MLKLSEPFSRRAFFPLTLSALTFPCANVAKGATPRQLQRLVRDWAAAQEELNIDKLLALYAEDMSFEDPTYHLSVTNKTEYRELLLQSAPMYESVKFTFTSIRVSGNTAVAEHTLSARIKDLKNPTAKRKHVAIRGVSIFETVDGKIKRHTDFFDVLTGRRQMSGKG